MASTIQQELATLLADLIQQKPTTKTDALALLQLLELRLASWLLADLPTIEAKAVLVARGLATDVEEVSICCGLCASKK